MNAPPGTTPTTPLFGEHITDARDCDLGTKNAKLRFLMRELGWERAACQRLIRAHELDMAEARGVLVAVQHGEAVDARGFADAAEVARMTFRHWVKARAVKQWTGEQRIRQAMAR